MSQTVTVKEPLISKKLFSEVGVFSFVWLAVRLYVGWEWVNAGFGKLFGGENWGSAAILGYWKNAVTVPATGRPAISYGWYRYFLQFLINIRAESWMAPLVAWGEFLVGIALILGVFTGIAAMFGAFMNMNYMLAGSASTNPVLMVLAIFLILAWKTAGWWGVDRWLLPRLGTPWTRVELERVENKPSPQTE